MEIGRDGGKREKGVSEGWLRDGLALEPGGSSIGFGRQ